MLPTGNPRFSWRVTLSEGAPFGWFHLQGQDLPLQSHVILKGNHGSEQALLGKCNQLQNHKIILSGTDLAVFH